MKDALIKKALLVLVGPFIGAFGAYMLTALPEVHNAFCAGVPL